MNHTRYILDNYASVKAATPGKTFPKKTLKIN